MSELAILGGSPVRTTPWPQWPERSKEEESTLLAALRLGDWGGFPLPNTNTAKFTDAFARRHDSQFGLCVANGTVSLEVALQAMGVEPGAEVLVPAYTFEATAAAVLFSGCVPVFVDVDPDSYCIDPQAAAAAISQKTQAILPVHLAMNIADMDQISQLAKQHGLKVLEDCAHAHGAAWQGKAAGSLGDAGSFSFQTSKLLTAGEGGFVTTNDEATFDRLHALVNCGRNRAGANQPVQVIGHNYRMTDLQATVLLAQLGRLDEQHSRRQANAEVLWARLPEIEGLSTLVRDPRVTNRAIYHFVFRYDPEAFGGLPRDVFVAALNAEGVPCDGRFYENLTKSPLLRPDTKRYPHWNGQEPQSECPNANRAAYDESVWISHHLLLGTQEDTSTIADAILKVTQNWQELLSAKHPEIERLKLARALRSLSP